MLFSFSFGYRSQKKWTSCSFCFWVPYLFCGRKVLSYPFDWLSFFLAKNQLSEKGPRIIVIPALPNSGPTNLCPVLTLLKYLDTAFGVRSKDSNRLFVPIKQGQNDITVKAISSWICSTVMLAYKSAGITLPRNQVKAQEVRAISSSWSIFNSASLPEILSAGFWRSDNTFYYHYLRSMPQHTDNLYSLGPLASAQKVIFPPTS